ncbi:MAG: DUF3006 domain-containing protein [Defluviitaleaceae bacterium]|nr:DUF3006 domain-containing protein [Defluviitaleaceae bacterium]
MEDLGDARFVVDRMAGGVATLERLTTLESVEISAADLPAGIRDGAVLIKTGEAWSVDEKETALRADAIKKKFDRLKKRLGKSGDH